MASRSVHFRKAKTIDDVLAMVDLGMVKIVAAMQKERASVAAKRGRGRVKMHADAA